MAGKHALHHLPLRKPGFEHAPAVPVDLPGMGDTATEAFFPTIAREARAGHAPDLAIGAEHRALRQGETR